MATVHTGKMTADQFWDWCQRPENVDRRVELDRGEVVEMPPPGEVHGVLCWWIGFLLGGYVQRHGGLIANNDTGLVVQEDPATVRGVDVMLFSEVSLRQPLQPGHSRRLPQLVVEVVSPSDKPNRLNRRIGDYLRRGVQLVWIIDPADRTVGVHRPGELPAILDEGDDLTGDGVLPDLRLSVAEVFKVLNSGMQHES